jgi:hypothetical protein
MIIVCAHTHTRDKIVKHEFLQSLLLYSLISIGDGGAWMIRYFLLHNLDSYQ